MCVRVRVLGLFFVLLCSLFCRIDVLQFPLPTVRHTLPRDGWLGVFTRMPQEVVLPTYVRVLCLVVCSALGRDRHDVVNSNYASG